MDDLSNKEIMDKIQEIALWISTQDNELLKPHLLPFMDKSLKTENKAIIKSINELKQRLDINDNSLETFMNELLPIIGDWKINPDLETDLQAIAPSILEAIIKLGEGTSTVKRTMSFQFLKHSEKINQVIIQSDYKGKISKIKAYCTDSPTTNTEVTIEKINSVDFENGGSWTDILSSPIVIENGQLVDNGSHVVGDDVINVGDIFRVKSLVNGGNTNLYVQVVFEEE